MGRGGQGGLISRNVIALGGGGGGEGISQVRQSYRDGNVTIATNNDGQNAQTVIVSTRTSQTAAAPTDGTFRAAFGLPAASSGTVNNRIAAAVAAELGPNVRVQVSREEAPREIAVGNQIIRGTTPRSGPNARGGGINTPAGALVVSIRGPRTLTNAQKVRAVERATAATRAQNQRDPGRPRVAPLRDTNTN